MADTGPGIEALEELAADIAANLKTFTRKAWRMETKDRRLNLARSHREWR